ncbi:MAG: hypothetical protein AB1330_01250 [Bacillota bacterium]
MGLLDAAAAYLARHGRAALESIQHWRLTRRPGLDFSVLGLRREWDLLSGEYSRRLARPRYEPGYLERLILESERVLTKELPFHWEESLRFADISGEVKRVFGGTGIEEFLWGIRPGVLRNLTRERLGQLAVQRRLPATDQQLDDLFRIIERYQKEDYKRKRPEFFAQLHAKTRQLFEEQIKELALRAGGGHAWLTGRRPATIEELLRRGYPFPERVRVQLEELVRKDKSWAGVPYDPGVLITPEGEIVDWRVFAQIKKGVAQWLEPTLPGRLLHLRDYLEMGKVSQFYLLQRGTLHPVLTGVPGERALIPETYVYAGGKVLPIMRPDQPLEGSFMLAPSRFGLVERLLRSVADIGVTAPAGQKWYDRGVVGSVRRALDIGYSTTPSIFARTRDFFTKFADPLWYRNLVEGAVRRGVVFDEATIEALRKFFSSTTPAPSPRVVEVLKHAAGYGGYRLETFEDFARVLDVIASPRGYRGPLKSLWYRSQRAPRELEEDVFLLTGRHPQRALTGKDIIARELGKEFARLTGYDSAKAELDLALELGKISRREHLEALQLINATMFEEAAAHASAAGTREEALALVEGLFRSPKMSRFQEEVLGWARRTFPYYAPGRSGGLLAEELLSDATVAELTPSAYALGQRYTVVRAAPSVSEAVEAIRERNDWTKLAALAKDVVYTPLVGGRRNLRELTFNVVRPLGPYHLLWRLSEALNEFGLGFSGRSAGSALDLYLSFALKRFLPVVGTWELLNYLDWELDQLTGYSMYERWARMVVRGRLALAPDEEKAEHLRHTYSMFPYLEQAAYWPHPSFPFIGYAFSYGLFGMSPRRPMSREELQQYYAAGYQEMRRGRFWFFGSRTPWWGSKVDYYLPNEYLMALSDWRYSQELYPEDTYWRYNWLPTPRFPFAPIQRLIDPYYFERLHYYDRPYPLTAPMFEELTPWGPILNVTLGEVFKPRRLMHPEEVMAGLAAAAAVPPTSAEAVVSGIPAPAEQLRLINEHLKTVGVMKGGTVTPQVYVPYAVPFGLPGGAGEAQGAPTAPYFAGYPAVPYPAAVHLPVAAQLRGINAAIRARGEFVAAYGPTQEQVLPPHFYLPTDVKYRMGEAVYMARELAGIYGFTTEALFGEVMPDSATLQSAARAYNLERRWWELANLGGLSGGISEIARRFLPHRMRHIEEINPIENLMPPWLPGPEYFKDFRHGDPYAIPYGEVRLPGEAYLRTHVVHPMPGFGLYGPVDIFLILADVAPWSPQARFWRDVVTHMDLPEDVRKQVAAAKRRMAAVKRKHTFYPYHFQTRYTDLARERVHVTRVLDLGMFLTEEYPEHPVRVAGVRAQGVTAEELGRFLRPGAEVTIAYNPYQKFADDTYGTIRAAVYLGDLSLARVLVERGYAKEALTDWSEAGVWSRFTPREIARAAFFERLAHLDTPLHTKFLHVRSPLESYLREQVYGDVWGDWKAPWSSWLVPTYQSFIARSPALAALSGALLGGFLGHFVMGRRGRWGAAIGGVMALGGSLWRTAAEHLSGEKWIPERVREVRDIEEYFDILAYLKYRGLYEYAARRALREEHVDVGTLLERARVDLEQRRKLVAGLEARKRRLYLETGERRSEEIKEINRRIAEIQAGAAKVVPLTPWASAALYYYQQYTSTVYGFEPGTPWTNIMRALPPQEREYFTHFAKTTDPVEQRKILEVVPRGQRRIYESLWGLPVESRVNLVEYFRTHYLPGPEWAGWRPEVNLEDIKVQVVQTLGKDIHDFDLWPADVRRAEAARAPAIPDIFRTGVPAAALREQLERILLGLGLEGVSVRVSPSDRWRLEVELTRDRTEEVRRRLREEFPRFVAA